MAPSISDNNIQEALQNWLENNPDFPQAYPNILYFVFTESGVSLTMQGECSCTAFCGYHGNIANGIYYAVTPCHDCVGCVGDKSVSHELSAAITDAIPGFGRYDQGNNKTASTIRRGCFCRSCDLGEARTLDPLIKR